MYLLVLPMFVPHVCLKWHNPTGSIEFKAGPKFMDAGSPSRASLELGPGISHHLKPPVGPWVIQLAKVTSGDAARPPSSNIKIADLHHLDVTEHGDITK